jgi:hypothetical protein
MPPEYGATRRRCQPVSGNGQWTLRRGYPRGCGVPESGRKADLRATGHMLLRRPVRCAAATREAGWERGLVPVTEGAARQTRCPPSGPARMAVQALENECSVTPLASSECVLTITGLLPGLPNLPKIVR